MDKLLNKLENNKKTPMHMPGHKRNTLLAPYLKKLNAEYDITEIDGYDNLHEPTGILKKSMETASLLCKSKKTFYLINGSTCGILSGIYAVLSDSDKVICARNCHKSVYNGLELTNADVVFLSPQSDTLTGGYGCLLPETVEKAIIENPDTKLIILTSPTYEGIVSDVSGICKVAHKHDIPVLVDEAHGAHFGFGYGFPESAVKCGADIVIQSLHKTLPSLTQTALIHINGSLVNTHAIAESLSVFETSSPSYLLMASIDGCINLLEEKGDELFYTWEKNLDFFYRKVSALKNLKILADYKNNFYDYDRSKFVVLTGNTDISGNELMNMLRCENFECEMSSQKYIIAMTGMGDTIKTFKGFADALIKIDKQCSYKKTITPPIYPQLPQKIFTPKQAKKQKTHLVPLNKSNSLVSAEYVWAYPPGIPILIPGEKITEETIAVLHNYMVNSTELKSDSGELPQKILVIN